MDSSNAEPNKFRSSLEWFILRRRKLRKKISTDERSDRILHLYTTSVFLFNVILILYALISITSRMLLNGVPLVDSIPLAFYILPLLIFLPKLLYDYYRTRSAIITIVIFLIVAVVFGMIASLIRGFVILVVLNIASIVIVSILGRFRPNAPLTSIGRKGLAWILILNSLGLMLPVSIVVMGQTPIATAEYTDDSTIYLEMPLSSYEYPYVNVSPTPSILSELVDSAFGVDLRVNVLDNDSVGRLEEWLTVLPSLDIPYRITSSCNIDDVAAARYHLIVSSNRIQNLYAIHWARLYEVISISDDLSLSTENLSISFDMTLQQSRWNELMNQTRSVNLQGFSELVRSSLDAIDSTEFSVMALTISGLLEEHNISGNMLVEGFVIDDLIDNDVTLMELCGITPEVIDVTEFQLEVQCDRSKYSEGMDGDVGEYLVHTYSLSPFSNSIRLGIVGSQVGLESVHSPVYQTMEKIATDIAIASSNGIEEIVVRSLPSIVSSFGISGISQLRDAIQSLNIVEITYTFRIFAFRAVVMAIDSFDFLMY